MNEEMDLESDFEENESFNKGPLTDEMGSYLGDIGNYKVLTFQEEQELFREIELGNYAVCGLAVKINVDENEVKLALQSLVNDRNEYPDLIAQIKTPDNLDLYRIAYQGELARKTVFERNLKLVVHIAKKYSHRGMELLDLIQEGNLGLIKAVEKFDYQRGNKFSTYATYWITQAISRGILDKGKSIRIPVHVNEQIAKLKKVRRQVSEKLGKDISEKELAEHLEENWTENKIKDLDKISQNVISLDFPVGEERDSLYGDFLSDEDQISQLDQYQNQETIYMVRKNINSLNKKEAEVIRMRFGIEHERIYTLDEVGKHFNVTRERVRQIEKKAIRKLKLQFHKDGLDQI